jgi:hypothetical protein
MTSTRIMRASVAATALAAAGLAGVQAASASAASTSVTVPHGFHVSVFATAPGKVTGPDDIARLDGRIFVGFQNGVGAKGEPSPTGATKSTVVEYSAAGKALASWNVTGKVDGLGADPSHDRVVATVNEDGNSSIYTVTPEAPKQDQVKHYTFGPTPLPHGGGTDSVVARGGTLYVTASAPAADANGTTYSQPALYTVTLENGVARWKTVIKDNATAVDAVTGKTVTLNLSDPDSSENVPWSVPRFGGDFLLDSQGDSQLIFLRTHHHKAASATVLNLTTQVDDTAFATGSDETLYVVDSGSNDILAITGPFKAGEAFTSVPKDSSTLASTLGLIDLSTGKVTAFGTGLGSPKGLLFVGGDCH